jgi:phage nucleotide-binding protein
MSLNFSTTAESATVENGIKMLVYAPAGYGKTVLTATLPTPLLLSAESGLLSLHPNNVEKIFGFRKDIPVIQISSIKDFQDAYEFCATSAHAKHFESFALDSISEIAEVVLGNAKRQVKDPRQAYGELGEKMSTLIRAFRDLKGKHIYFAAKQDREKDETTGMMLYGPSMPGKQLTREIAHFFDEVFALGINKTPEGVPYRFLRTRADVQFQAKDRSGALDELEEPNLTKIISKIQTSHV